MLAYWENSLTTDPLGYIVKNPGSNPIKVLLSEISIYAGIGQLEKVKTSLDARVERNFTLKYFYRIGPRSRPALLMKKSNLDLLKVAV